MIQHQFQRVSKTFLCHFPNYENPEIGDEIQVATLQFISVFRISMSLSPSPSALCKHGKGQTHISVTAFAEILALLQTL